MVHTINDILSTIFPFFYSNCRQPFRLAVSLSLFLSQGLSQRQPFLPTPSYSFVFPILFALFPISLEPLVAPTSRLRQIVVILLRTEYRVQTPTLSNLALVASSLRAASSACSAVCCCIELGARSLKALANS